MKNYCYKAKYLFNLEVNTIPDLAAADELESKAEHELKKVVFKRKESASNVVVDVTAKTYDDTVSGTVAYKVACSFTDDSKKDIAFGLGCDIADTFERLGHVVKDWAITANDLQAIDKKSVKRCEFERR